MNKLLGLFGAVLLGAAHIGAAAPVTTSNGEYSIEYVGQTPNGGLIDFTWQICKLTAEAPVLNHVTFALDFSDCAPGVPLEDIVAGGTVTTSSHTEQNVLIFWNDPDTGLSGVSFTGLSWLDAAAGSCATFTLSLDPSALPAGSSFGEGPVQFGARAGTQSICGCSDVLPGYAEVLGPVCSQDTGYEGHTPGYWKNHVEAWTPPYVAATTLAGAGFTGGLYQGSTLLQALAFKGGPDLAGAQQILYRAAVSALLNAASPDINYPLTVAQVLAQTNVAIATGNRAAILALATTLDGYNNLGVN